MKRFGGDESGNMALLFALAFSLIGVVAAIGVDSASLYHERRMMQAAVDLAALTAAAHPQDAAELAALVMADAGFETAASLVVTTGRYEPDPALDPRERFVAGAEPINAVEVFVQRPGRLYFGSGISARPMIAARGLAMIEPQVAFSVGSGLASLNNGIANKLLGQLLGTTLSLSLVHYNGLANTRVNAFAFLDALAFQMSLDALTYDDVLASQASTGEIAAALSSLVTGVDKTVLTTIAQAGSGNAVPLDSLLGLGDLGRLALDGGSAAIAAKLSVLDILSAAAMLADGSRQAVLKLSGGLPGITEITASLAVGEPTQGSGWFAFGPGGTVLRTAQVRLRLEVKLVGTLKGYAIQLPLWLDLAHAEAQVVSASCPTVDEPFGTAQVAVLPGVAKLAIGQVTDTQLRNFGAALPVTPATLIDALLLRVVVSSQVEVAQATPIVVDFSSDEIEAGTKKTARTTGILSSLTQSLLGNLNVQVPILGGLLGLSLNGVTSLLMGLLNPLVTPLDSVLDALLSALGLGIGEADVRVYEVQCSKPVLVG